MLKYVDAKVVFAEVPNEITLAINISNCPCQCKGCHSSYLAQDIGTELTFNEVRKLIKKNSGISWIALMGGDAEPDKINTLASFITNHYNSIKVAWYSGRQELSNSIDLFNFDYIKLGPYKEELGPLNSRTTNQRFYKVNGTNYFTFNITNSKCDDCGYITKHPITECPKCHSNHITQYTRVIGYLRPIKSFGKDRQIEASKRVYSKNI